MLFQLRDHELRQSTLILLTAGLDGVREIREVAAGEPQVGEEVDVRGPGLARRLAAVTLMPRPGDVPRVADDRQVDVELNENCV